jgi:hypothetical protein
MGTKTEKFLQNLQNIEFFIKHKLEKNGETEGVIQQLQKLTDTIKTEQLTLQVVSQAANSIQAIAKLLNSKPELLEICRIEYNILPTYFNDRNQSKIATLEINKEIALEKNVYRLEPEKEYLLGRGNDCHLQLNPQLNKGISWHHALVRSREFNGLIQWELVDCQSTNGTFINGKKVVETEELKQGDRITLGYWQARLGIAELVFNLEALTLEKDLLYQSIIDRDILLLAINLQPFLTSEVQQFIISLNNYFLGKICLLVDLANNDLNSLKNLEIWLKKNLPNLQVDLIPIELKALAQNKNSIDVAWQKQRDNFYKNIDNIVKRQGDSLLVERFIKKLDHILEPIDLVLRSRQEILPRQIAQRQQEIEEISQINLKEVIKKVTAQFNEEKDHFFKQVKQDLTQAKGALLDSYSKQSLICKLQNTIEKSQPIISNYRGEKRVKLQVIANSQPQDINQYLINFCISFLSKWSETEWDKVSHVYGEGGLNSLLERCSTYTQAITPAKDSLFEPPQSLDISRSLLNSFVQNDSEVAYKETSIFDYILKQLRTNMMQIMMMFTLILPLIGIKVNKTILFGHLSQFFVKYPWSFGIFICLISYLLMNAYKQDNQAKLEEACQVLKKNANSYYQSFAKNLCDRAIQEINWALEEEEKKMMASLAKVEEVYTEKMLNTEKKLIQLKSALEQDKLQQKNLEKEVVEFNSLKRV